MPKGSYDERQRPITIPAALVAELWRIVKNARDEAMQAAADNAQRERNLDLLLERMSEAGMSEHLPTLEEVQAAWRGEG